MPRSPACEICGLRGSDALQLADFLFNLALGFHGVPHNLVQTALEHALGDGQGVEGLGGRQVAVASHEGLISQRLAMSEQGLHHAAIEDLPEVHPLLQLTLAPHAGESLHQRLPRPFAVVEIIQGGGPRRYVVEGVRVQRHRVARGSLPSLLLA
jgi:hypothetical protein